ncbi:MAG: response regulator [Clostridiales Family XIII bacterium]|jgi:signal transduction histidine kinase/CheY-like chemotaxis protein|nr:response regulator [Clostridiales Family XIII bacterium]
MKKFLQGNIAILLFLFSAIVVLVMSIFTGVMMSTISNFLTSDLEERLLATSRLAAVQTQAEELAQLQIPEDMETPLFLDLKERLIEFAEESNVLYVYYMRLTEDGMAQFIIDNDLTEDTVNLDTEPIEMEEAPADAFAGTAAATALKSYSIGYDGILSAFAPVFDASGHVAAVAGVDIIDEQILSIRDYTKWFVIILIASMLLVIVSGMGSFALYRRNATRAEQASRAKGDFLANMSHEMRTPMNAIIGMANIAMSTDDPAKKEYGLTKIQEASAHLLGVINDILDTSKIEANKFELSFIDFSMKNVLFRAADIIRFRVEEKQQEFSISCDEAIPPALNGDDQRLLQVIMNLLSNAAKFTPEKGAIKLSAALVSEENKLCTIRVDVEDNGIGVTDEQKRRLFTSFEQADSSTSRQFGGTGLGLAISKHIVEMMGGGIDVTSEPGKGSVFSFTVKAAVGQAENLPDDHRQTKNMAEMQDAFAGHCILLAEDIEINAEIVKTILAPTGIAIDCAANGLEAVRMFSGMPGRYEMIFMDIQMPEMDGYEATRRIRALDDPWAKKVPIIAMTANVFQEDVEKTRVAGMDAHVGKPLDLDEVLGILTEYIK